MRRRHFGHTDTGYGAGVVRNDVTNTVGTAVLLAAAPAGRGRAMDAASVLPVLAAVPAGVLAGTHMATVVELADPLDPQSVLTRLRAAAATPGPLALYLAGQLQLDRRQRLAHLALARSTPATLRYTGLPWHWLAGELAPRRPGTTTVVADLAADPELWQRLTDTPDALQLVPSVALFAHLTPFPRRGVLATPDYLRHFATIWRSGARPPLPQLHEEAAAAAREAGREDAILLSPGTPGGAFGAAPTVAGTGTAGAIGGGYVQGAPEVRPPAGPGVSGTGAGSPGGAPGVSPVKGDAHGRAAEPVAGPAPMPAGIEPRTPEPAAEPAEATHTRAPVEAAGPSGVSHPPAPGARTAPTPPPAAPAPVVLPSQAGVVDAPSAPGRTGAPVNGPRPQAPERPQGAESASPAASPEPGAAAPAPQAPAPAPVPAPGHGVVPPRPPLPAAPPVDGPPRPGSGIDPHPAILAAARAGRHGEAAGMAAAWESDALRRHGPRSGEAVHWVEVRADLARLADEPARSCELWIAAAQARLGLSQGPDEPDVEGAVDRAHHQWEQITDPVRARALGPALIELRRRVPGRRAGALAALQRKMT
jgi:hypothetical protein